jgi:hypothetical protein
MRRGCFNARRNPQKVDKCEQVREHGVMAADEDRGSSAPPVAPESSSFGDLLDWTSPLVVVDLLVELPFWLMIDDCELVLPWGPIMATVRVHSQHREVYAGEVLDSRSSLVYRGPRPDLLDPQTRQIAADQGLVLVERPSRTVIRMQSMAHSDVFRAWQESFDPGAHPRLRAEADAYLATLCEAHISLVNDLVQRYRLATYDYFAFEVSPWDVPIWTVNTAEGGVTIRLLPYRDWDRKPVIVGPRRPESPDLPPRPFRFTDVETLLSTDPMAATPGELDLLDARSLMERGDYTGAVRRTVTAIEAVLEWALAAALRGRHDEAEVQGRLAASQNDFPGRLRQWLRLGGVQVPDVLLVELEVTRGIRHDIVHGARRIGPSERGVAQRCVDSGRWLFNFIEQRPARRDLREKPNVLRSVGRSALSPRFSTALTADGVRVQRS